MASIVIENLADLPPETAAPDLEVDNAPHEAGPRLDMEAAVDLGVWLSSLESFYATGRSSFAGMETASVDTVREFQLSHAALLRCAVLNSQLLSDDRDLEFVSGRELADLQGILRDCIVLGDSLQASPRVGPAEWKAWGGTASARLTRSPAYSNLVRNAVRMGHGHLPDQLVGLVNAPRDAEQAELALLLPRFGMVLRWLDVVGRMLSADEPLKPALVIFASVSEQVHDLIDTINNRLERFPDEEAELFGSLDAAAYTASIELRKVYTQELAGVVEVRSSPSVYAKMETAHSLLHDGFQQMLVGFVRSIDPKVDQFKLFPNFRVKFDQSLVLRRELFDLAAIVRLAEEDPERANIDAMRASVREFMNGTVRFLFYKDSETVERFVEEIALAKQNKDLVPILHRFGAYLDTLFGQVSLRTLLADHPFE